MTHNILVIGGTGKTGRRVVENLEKLEHHVRVGSRNSHPRFDWDDESTWTMALQGMDRAYIVYHPDLAVPGAKEAISKLTEMALQEGLEKVVLLSGKGEKEAEACEEIVAQSGLNYTLIRASWFNQNFNESFLLDPILAGHVALPMPEARIPFVDADDIAEVVTQVLLDDSYNGRTVTVTGPRQMTFEEVVKTIAKASERNIGYQPISIQEYEHGMKQAGLPDNYTWLFSYLFREVLGNPANQDVSDDFEKITGRKATDFEEYAEKVASSGIWNQEVNTL